jgi:Flp pilus assembly protein TadG
MKTRNGFVREGTTNMRTTNRAAKLPGVKTAAWSLGKRMLSALRADKEGNTIVETALVLPILLTVVTGIWQFGLVYNNLISLTQGTTAGAQVLQSDRLSASNDPCADTFNAIANAAPTLTRANITVTITMDNHSPITGQSCSGRQSQLAIGGPVTVQATYPYNVSVVGLSVTSGVISSGAVTEIEY